MTRARATAYAQERFMFARLLLAVLYCRSAHYSKSRVKLLVNMSSLRQTRNEIIVACAQSGLGTQEIHTLLRLEDGGVLT